MRFLVLVEDARTRSTHDLPVEADSHDRARAFVTRALRLAGDDSDRFVIRGSSIEKEAA